MHIAVFSRNCFALLLVMNVFSINKYMSYLTLPFFYSSSLYYEKKGISYKTK